VENFRTIDYGFCKGESDQPYLIGYVNPIRIEEVLINDFRNNEFHQKILDIFNKEVNINEPNIGWINGKWPFNNVTLLPESIILRNLSNVNIAHNTLTVELFKNGGMKFMMPITLKDLGNYSIMRMKDCCSRNTIDPHNIIKWAPIYDFMMPVIGLFINYFRFLHHYNYKDVLELTFEGKNIWRVCLFSEDDSYFDYIQKFSLPIIIKENIKYPEKPCKIHIASDKTESSFIMVILTILTLALYGFGMPISEVFTIFKAEATKKALL
jgi:hypothetical protein